MTEEIRPCPCCGEQGFLINTDSTANHEYYVVRCQKGCGLETAEHCGANDDGINAVILLWNQRRGLCDRCNSLIEAWNNPASVKRVFVTESCGQCDHLDKCISNSIDQNYYRCGVWIAERIRKAVQKENEGVASRYERYDECVSVIIDKILEEERQRQECKK